MNPVPQRKSGFGKDWKPSSPESDGSRLADRAGDLRAALRLQRPDLVAGRSGASYLERGPGSGELHVPLWGHDRILTWPELIGYSSQADALPAVQQTLLLYYLITADGTPLTGRWVSFAELPGGRMYNTAFQGYSGDEAAKTFGLDLAAFEHACVSEGGKKAAIGNVAYVFEALPRVPLLATYWLGDEEFPSSAKILFDESACHYLPIDACAVLGSMLVHRLIMVRR